jgi:hypothetical protein
MNLQKSVAVVLFFLGMSGCALPPSLSTATSTVPQPPITATFTPTILPSATTTSTIPPTTTTELALQVCSPLQGIERGKLKDITSNPWVEPLPYVEKTDRHPAIDFSFYHFEKYDTFANFPIQSILPGKVILIENNRFPYGNMVLIETPLSQVDSTFLPKIPIPTPLPPSVYTIEDRCPVNGNKVTYDPAAKSIYVLYAHLSSLPLVKIGDTISCGEQIGFAGKTGNAAEEHLHLEIRIGPSNALFSSIASYHSSVTLEERYNYCIWTASGVFQAIDPAILLYPEK